MALLCGFATANAQVKIGGKKINVEKAVKAGSDATKAMTLSDGEISKISKEYMIWMDTHNPLCPPESEYSQRLQKLVGDITETETGVKLNFGVYHVIDIFAFGSEDGSVRVCAGMMDEMTDEQVMVLIGHEIGHIVNKDAKETLKNAYLRSAAKNATAAVDESAGKTVGAEDFSSLAEELNKVQFSSKQENAADDYAMQFCIDNHIAPSAVPNTLNKMVELFKSGGDNAAKIRHLYSAHPDSDKRAVRMQQKADKYAAAN